MPYDPTLDALAPRPPAPAAVDPLAPPPARETPSQGGIGGFFTNAWRDVTDTVHGVGALLSIAGSDLAKLVTGNWHDFKLDDVVKALPSAIKQDYEARYGSLAKVGEGIYQHPLSFIADALSVATLGGWAAARGAMESVKAAGETETLAKIGEIAKAEGVAAAEKALGETSPVVQKAAKTLGVAGREAANVELAGLGPTKGIEQLWSSYNPAKRFIWQGFYAKVATKPIEALQGIGADILQKSESLGASAEQLTARAGNLATLADEAAQRGTQYVLRPTVAKLNLNRFADHFFGLSGARFVLKRSEDTGAFDTMVKAVAAVTGGDENAARDQLLTKTDTVLFRDGYVRMEDFGPLVPDAQRVQPQGIPLRWFGNPNVTDAKQAIEAGTKAVKDVYPDMVRRYKTGVSYHVAKEPEVVAKEAVGTPWRNNTNIAGVRIASEDVVRQPVKALADARDYMASKGYEMRAITENTLFTPDAGAFGRRRLVAVFSDKAGTPLTLQLMSPSAARVSDYTDSLLAAYRAAAQDLLAHGDELRSRIASASGAEAESLKAILDLKERQVEAARALLRDAWTYPTDETRNIIAMAGPEGKPYVSAVRMLDHENRATVYERLTRQEIASGQLTPLSAFENTYLPQRLVRGAEYNVKKNMVEGGPPAFQLHAEAMQNGVPAPIYVPGIRSRDLSRGDWLQRKSTLFRGTRSGAANPHMKRSSGYLWASVYGPAAKPGAPAMVTNLSEAYAIRAVRHIRAQENMDFISGFLNQAGRRITHPDQLADNEALAMPDILVNASRVDRALNDAHDSRAIEALRQVQEGRKQIAELSDPAMRTGLQKAMQLAMGANAEQVASALKLFDAGEVPQMWAVPKTALRRFEAQMGRNVPNVRLWFGTPLTIWRNWVLSGSPRWVVNNVIGNTIMLKMAGGRLSDVFRQMSPDFRATLDNFIGETARPKVASGMFSQTGVRTTHMGSSYEDAIAGNVAKKIADRYQANPIARRVRSGAELIRRANEAAEDAFRKAAYIVGAERTAVKGELAGLGKTFWTSKESLDHVFAVGLDEKTAAQAVNHVNAFLNDYTASTPLARNVIRPYIAPFWSFYRHATTLVLTSPFKIPGTYRMMQLLTQAANDVQTAMGIGPGQVPDWLAGAMPLGPIGAGDTRYFNAIGPNPFNVVTGNLVSMLSPVAKMLLERATGRSALTGRPFTSPDVVTPFGSDQQYQIIMVGGKPTAVPIQSNVPTWWEQIASQFPQYTVAKDVFANASTYDRTTLLDLIQGKGVRLDPKTGQPLYPKDRLATLMKFLGFSTTPFDVQQWQAQQADQQAAAIAQWLKAHPQKG